MSELRVIRPGLLTTVQDLGRWGFQSQGVSVAGPMDAYAHRLANALVGNAAAAATLEVTLIGPDLQFEDERAVAVTGAVFDIALDDRPVAMGAAFAAHPGSRLTFGRRQRGARAYLAVQGGIDVPPVLGSRATHVVSGIGGIEGRALQAGDRLPLGPGRTLDEGTRREPLRESVSADGSFRGEGNHDKTRLRILRGPQTESFSDDALAVLQTAAYTVDPTSDRMGLRLRGDAIRCSHEGEMISDVTPMGTLQVPPSGLPILLMAERQTTGGYPQLATVITADLHLAGQLAPGDEVAFAICSMAEAMRALIAQERTLMRFEQRHEGTR